MSRTILEVRWLPNRVVWVHYGHHVNETHKNLKQEFINSGYALREYCLEQPRWKKVGAILKTLHIENGRIKALSSLDPSIYRRARIPYPECMGWPTFVLGDGIIVGEGPHFLYRDVDYYTIYRDRQTGRRTFMFDHIPDALLGRMIEAQYYAFERAHHVFTMSAWEARNLVSNGISKTKISVVGAGANIPALKENAYGEDNIHRQTAVFVGRDFERKGGLALLGAWKAVKRQVPAAKLYIVGP